MATIDFDRLSKLANMMASDQGDGIVAAKKATEYLKSAGMNWADLIEKAKNGGASTAYTRTSDPMEAVNRYNENMRNYKRGYEDGKRAGLAELAQAVKAAKASQTSTKTTEGTSTPSSIPADGTNVYWDNFVRLHTNKASWLRRAINKDSYAPRLLARILKGLNLTPRQIEYIADRMRKEK